jgi:hypothetical protein
MSIDRSPSRRMPRAAAVAAVIGAVTVAVALGAGCLPIGATATDRADDWDPQVLEVARTVERLRGLEFRRPVEVRSLPDARFERTLVTTDDDLSARERRDLDWAERAVRALGLLGSDVGLLDAWNVSLGPQTAAYYESGTDRITMRDGPLTPAVRVTLAHELVHALQDQVFGLDRVQRRSPAPLTVDAVIEGDATRTEERYLAQLPRAQRRAAIDEAEAQADAADDVVLGLDAALVPDLVRLQQSAPYSLGPLLVEGAKSRWWGGVNGLYRRPPRSEAALVSPWMLGRAGGLGALDEQPLGAGERRIGPRERIDAFGLYVLLASRIGPDRALAAADRWGGDEWIVLERDGVTCSRVTVRSRTGPGVAVLADAAERWAAAMSPGTASTSVADRRVALTGCSDGSAAGPAPAGADAVEEFLWWRNYLFAEIGFSQPESVARCAADRTARDPVLVPFSSASTGATDADVAALWARVDVLSEECGGDGP